MIVSDTDEDFQYRPKAKIKIVGDEIDDLVECSSDEDYSNKPALKKLKAEVNMDLFEDGNHASKPVLINNSDSVSGPISTDNYELTKTRGDGHCIIIVVLQRNLMKILTMSLENCTRSL